MGKVEYPSDVRADFWGACIGVSIALAAQSDANDEASSDIDLFLNGSAEWNAQ